MNITEYINEFYAGVDDEEVFEYDDEEDIHTTEDSLEYETLPLFKVKYDEKEYYFTSDFRKVKYSKEKDIYYLVPCERSEKLDFQFPNNHTYLLKLQPKLNLEYDEIHDLIIDKAIQIGILYVQCNYLNYCYDEVELLRKRFKEVSKFAENTQMNIIKLQEENEILKKRLDKLERMNSANKVDSYINRKQTVI